MPGQNLTREEAATRADLIAVHSYDVVLDLATGSGDLRDEEHGRFSRRARVPTPSSTSSASPSSRST